MPPLRGTRWKSSFRHSLLTIASVLCVFLCVCVPSAKGGIIVTFDTSVPDPLMTGFGGYVDVFAAADSGTQLLDAFQVQVAITPGGGSPGPVGGLIFSPAQTEAQLGIGGAAGYVFFGNSLSEYTLAPIGTVTGGGTGYSGYDATFDFVPMTLTTTAQLLYRLDLSAIAAGTYTIDVVPAVSSFVKDQLDPLNPANIIPFTSTPGGLTVDGAAAVPEPATTVLLLVTLSGVALRRRFVRRQPIA